MREDTGDESDWVSAHAFYHEDLGRLVTDVVDPLGRELIDGGFASRWFFLRYWDGGPHVRLRVLPSSEAQRPPVERLIVDRFTDYFADRPSADTVAADDYARAAPRLADWEDVPGYFGELQPNNTVAFIPYRRERARYGDGRSIAAVERHFWESSEVAIRALRSPLSPERRVAAGAAMIAATWFCREPDAARLAARLSTEGGVPADPPQEKESPAVAIDGTALVDLIRRMRALVEQVDAVESTGSLAAWVRSVGALRDVLAGQVANGALTTPKVGWQGPGGVVADDPDAVLVVLDVCGHLVCNRLGVTTVLEGAVRRQLADAVRIIGEEGK